MSTHQQERHSLVCSLCFRGFPLVVVFTQGNSGVEDKGVKLINGSEQAVSAQRLHPDESWREGGACHRG